MKLRYTVVVIRYLRVRRTTRLQPDLRVGDSVSSAGIDMISSCSARNELTLNSRERDASLHTHFREIHQIQIQMGGDLQFTILLDPPESADCARLDTGRTCIYLTFIQSSHEIRIEI